MAIASAALLLLSAAHAAFGQPTVSARQHRGVTHLTVTPPPGEHINQDGPADLTGQIGAAEVQLAVTGALLATHGLVLPGDGAVQATLRVPLCEDRGEACRVATVTVAGTPTRRSSVLALSSTAPGADHGIHHSADVEAAFAEAARTDRAVLIDFGAVWCPPCNLMAAEVLEDPADQAALAPFVVVAVDVDDPASWTLKDRYQIGGYPTVILAAADGTEQDRLLGYPGEAQMLAWLAAAAAPPAVPLTLEAATSAQAAAEARRLADRGMADTARLWLEKAAGDDGVDAHIARLSVAPAAEDARWLMAHAVPLEQWIWSVMPLLESEEADVDEALPGELRAAIAAALPSRTGVQAADLLYLAAEVAADPADQAALYGAAAQTLADSLSGTPARDRGHWTFLAQLREKAGDAAGARTLLVDAVGHYPEEFTFHYALGALELRQEQAEAAITSARKAVEHGYGDNQLRAVRLLAEALQANGQTGAATALLKETLAQAARPPEELKVRTPRYLKALEDLLDDIEMIEAAER